MCGPVTYNITVMPSHGMIMMTNETVYNIIGLNYNTTYTITVYANNDHTSGEPTAITVKTKPLPAGKYNCINMRNYYTLLNVIKASRYILEWPCT